jgi:hypothetical protein
MASGQCNAIKILEIFLNRNDLLSLEQMSEKLSKMSEERKNRRLFKAWQKMRKISLDAKHSMTTTTEPLEEGLISINYANEQWRRRRMRSRLDAMHKKLIRALIIK